VCAPAPAAAWLHTHLPSSRPLVRPARLDRPPRSLSGRARLLQAHSGELCWSGGAERKPHGRRQRRHRTIPAPISLTQSVHWLAWGGAAAAGAEPLSPQAQQHSTVRVAGRACACTERGLHWLPHLCKQRPPGLGCLLGLQRSNGMSLELPARPGVCAGHRQWPAPIIQGWQAGTARSSGCSGVGGQGMCQAGGHQVDACIWRQQQQQQQQQRAMGRTPRIQALLGRGKLIPLPPGCCKLRLRHARVDVRRGSATADTFWHKHTATEGAGRWSLGSACPTVHPRPTLSATTRCPLSASSACRARVVWSPCRWGTPPELAALNLCSR